MGEIILNKVANYATSSRTTTTTASSPSGISSTTSRQHLHRLALLQALPVRSSPHLPNTAAREANAFVPIRLSPFLLKKQQ